MKTFYFIEVQLFLKADLAWSRRKKRKKKEKRTVIVFFNEIYDFRIMSESL